MFLLQFRCVQDELSFAPYALPVHCAVYAYERDEFLYGEPRDERLCDALHGE